MNGDDDKGFLWNLPVVKSDQLGKVGPAFGFGAGCGLGFGAGLLGGSLLNSTLYFSISHTCYAMLRYFDGKNHCVTRLVVFLVYVNRENLFAKLS